ncbi:MAG: FAD-binding oxidoreductase [Bdellovibrionales bacterium]|nr:FAD-binding oxidoreductase [Bdellovibrionales bacterium]
MSLSHHFLSFLGPDQVLEDPLDRERYGSDTAKDFCGKAGCVLLPKTTEEVVRVVQSCNEHNLGIIPSGGRTGLCGGATALNDEVVLSLERMNKIVSIDPGSRLVRCQAGVVTEKLQGTLHSHQLTFPLAIASQGSSQIGGNIATNAGGMHFIYYGSIRSHVIALQVVTGRGELLKIGRPLYKNQTGYDLKHLFIGSEGTLGIITELTLSVVSLPPKRTVAVFGSSSLENLLSLLRVARSADSPLLAFEFFTDKALELVTKHRNLTDPFQTRYPFYGLLEFGRDPSEVTELAEALFLPLIEDGTIDDMVVGQSESQSKALLSLRESISETVSSHYLCHKNDISVPVSITPDFLTAFKDLFTREAPAFTPILFGHLGDGNIHINWIGSLKEDRERFFSESHRIDRLVMALVDSFGGSVSAEHGIGLLKKEFLSLTRTPEEIHYMKEIKRLFDPKGILNPGKVFDLEQSI